MFLCITFKDEMIPFILSEATEEECLKAIEMTKKNFSFNKINYVVESDRIILRASPKKGKPKKRIYCYDNKIILETRADYSEEIQPTKELLAYEKNINIEKICVIEI